VLWGLRGPLRAAAVAVLVEIPGIGSIYSFEAHGAGWGRALGLAVEAAIFKKSKFIRKR
jgi:hypothetical protein